MRNIQGKILLLLILLVAVVSVVSFWRDGTGGPSDSDDVVGTPHFLDSTPLHNEVYAAQPINITINFDTDLAAKSAMAVRSLDGQLWNFGPTLIEDVATALKVQLKSGLPDGQYVVEYMACLLDGSCANGQFSFQIDSRQIKNYVDRRGQKEIIVAMKELAFADAHILISAGTKITWVNDDLVGHFVNTETHPEHTYFAAQNSREIPPQEKFSTTFDLPGQYNYHCSAHVPEGMQGSIVVDSEAR